MMKSYWSERMGPKARLATGIAALILLPIYFFPVLPVWMMHLQAPQYMEGLEIIIYTNDVRGDLQNVNILNHYVGMKAISADDFKEFRFMPALLTGFGLWALVSAFFGRRWFAALGWGVFSLASLLLLADFGFWLWKYGHDLDPKAALKLDKFTPPLIGFTKMGNFKVGSFPHVGGVLLLLAGGLGPITAFFEWRSRRRIKKSASENRVGIAKSAAVVVMVAAVAALFWHPPCARAARVEVQPGAAALHAALARATSGDTLLLSGDVYQGNFSTQTGVALIGRPGTVLDGGGVGTVFTGRGGSFIVRDLVVRRSGPLLLDDDAGIHLINAAGSLIENVGSRDNLHGVYLERCQGAMLKSISFHGRSGEVTEGNNGNAIHLWYSPDVLIEDVLGSGHRDGAYVSFCERVAFRRCRFHHSDRYGLHYMYSQENSIVDCTFDHNVAGAAIMFSNHLMVRGNHFVENDDPRAYGLLLRDCSDGVFEKNLFRGNTVALFLDNSHRNQLVENLLHQNAWGFYIYASSVDNLIERNDIYEVTFPVAIDQNKTSNRFNENYWSNAASYDLDGDRRADNPYRPVGLFAFLSKRYPDLSLFAESPAVQAISTAERLLPALAASQVADSLPAMKPWNAVSLSSRTETSSGESSRFPLALGAGVLALGSGGLLWRLRQS